MPRSTASAPALRAAPASSSASNLASTNWGRRSYFMRPSSVLDALHVSGACCRAVGRYVLAQARLGTAQRWAAPWVSSLAGPLLALALDRSSGVEVGLPAPSILKIGLHLRPGLLTRIGIGRLIAAQMTTHETLGIVAVRLGATAQQLLAGV